MEETKKNFTCRFLVADGTEATEGQRYAHVTAGYLGAADADTIAGVEKLAQQAEKTHPFRAIILKVVMLGPNKDIPAYEVGLNGPTSKLAEDLWDQFGQLEPWQHEQGLSKGFFRDDSDDPSQYTQTHHITMKNGDPKSMKTFVRTVVSLTSFDIKPVGRFAPVCTIPL